MNVFETSSIILQYFILAIQFFLLLIPFLGSGALYDRRKKIHNRFSKRGYLFLGLAILLIISTIIQNRITENLNTVKEDKFRKDIATRDSSNQFYTQELLAKYGLKVDSKNDEIVRMLRDSSLGKTTIVNGEFPILKICKVEIDSTKSDTLNVTYSYCSKDASSYNINVSLDVVGFNLEKEEFVYIGKNQRDMSNATIAKDEVLTSKRQIYRGKSENRYYIFRLYGTYEKFDKHVVIIDERSLYDMKHKSHGIFTPEIQVLFNKFLTKNK